jgi:hypothetical protein
MWPTGMHSVSAQVQYNSPQGEKMYWLLESKLAEKDRYEYIAFLVK